MQLFFLTKSFPDRRPLYKTWDFFGSPLNGNIFIRESDMLGNLNIFFDLGDTPKNIDLRHVESELAKCSEKYEAQFFFEEVADLCRRESIENDLDFIHSEYVSKYPSNSWNQR